ncbi:Cupredoxin [Cokeromyces recurvatus]|uniref:Cupredoxin n=1 Tax=Cokeromyces recurvatus TaxID=90255 RepID=UPI00221E509D|nr:Cupredoxin [Cokeromyces recurvatus]KAI7902131.1 Cupredoxin [Cokeromyces recurvatus]
MHHLPFAYLIFIIFLQFVFGQNYYINPPNTPANNIRNYEFNISQGLIDPDCSGFIVPIFLINNQMPGPTIEANQGDTVRILIRNQLKKMSLPNDHRHDIAIHFHGIRQYGSPQADGVPFLTQLPIKPGETYLHEFRVINQAGTFFYHAHVGFQDETLFGPFIIYESQEARPTVAVQVNSLTPPPPTAVAGPYQYHHEHTILLSEWWHRPPLEFEKYLMGPDFTIIPEAESILMNGQAIYNPNQPVMSQCKGYHTFSVQPQRTYRLRFIGATPFRTLNLAIAKHNLTIIEIDGELTKPYTVNQLEIAPGQRFSVLLHTDQAIDDYSIQVIRAWSDTVPRPTNGLSILRYTRPDKSNNQTLTNSSITLQAPVQRPLFEDEDIPFWKWSKIKPLYGVDPVVYKPSTRTILLRSYDQRQPDGSLRWLVNGISYSESNNELSPILNEIKNNRRLSPGYLNQTITAQGYDRNLGTYPINFYDVVDIVIQNTHIPGEPCRSHPWHTHGHSHWEIAHGKGEYIEERDADIRNIPQPIAKDITMVYPIIDPHLTSKKKTAVDKTPVGCGWSKIRILADNPGVWAVHCHNTAHMMMGMMVVLEEAPELIPRY